MVIAILALRRDKKQYPYYSKNKGKVLRMDFWDCFVTFHDLPKRCNHSLKETIIFLLIAQMIGWLVGWIYGVSILIVHLMLNPIG